jgi:hypothetical protein
LDYIIPDELKSLLGENTKSEVPTLEDYVIDFGKHKGKTFIDVMAIEPDYIRWAKENLTREPARTLLSQL